MEGSEISFVLFIDYDNLLPAQKRAGILDVVGRALIQMPMDAKTTRGKCEVRVYGGWYEENEITRLAQDVSIELQRDFPRIIRLRTGQDCYASVTANAELAVALFQEPGHHLFNTYRRKGKPSNVRVEEPAGVGCADPACILPLMKKLLKSGKCPKSDCGVVVGDLVYRHEQKIVDTMLSCDLIHAASVGYDSVILVSGDDDFLPPLRTILLRGASAVRFHPRPGIQRAIFLQGGVQLEEREL